MKSSSHAAALPSIPDHDEALSARQFRTIAELGGDMAIAIALPTRRLGYLSPAFSALSGFESAALQQALDGDGVSSLAPLAAWLRAAAEGQPGVCGRREFDLLDAEGRPLALDALAMVLPGDGDGASLVGSLRDLAARRGHQSEQKRFASMLNHEFRTPLATIDGAIQRLEATSSHADEPTRTRYRKIGAAVDRLIEMLDEYLSPDRMAALGRVRQPNTITVSDLVETGATQIRAAGREAVLQLDELAPGDKLQQTLRGEPEGLRLALKVLIDNALAFSPPSAAVTLRARRSGGGIELAVLDGGAGVPPDDVTRVFDKGYRGRNAAGMAGSGLGLYMARSIVEVHGGVLGLAPGEEGAGAEFRLWMPALGL